MSDEWVELYKVKKRCHVCMKSISVAEEPESFRVEALIHGKSLPGYQDEVYTKCECIDNAQTMEEFLRLMVFHLLDINIKLDDLEASIDGVEQAVRDGNPY